MSALIIHCHSLYIILSIISVLVSCSQLDFATFLFDSSFEHMVHGLLLSTRGTRASDIWCMCLADKPMVRGYHLTDYDWTPASQNPAQACDDTVSALAYWHLMASLIHHLEFGPVFIGRKYIIGVNTPWHTVTWQMFTKLWLSYYIISMKNAEGRC